MRLVLTFVCALVVAGCGAAREEPGAAARGDLTLDEARAFDDFPLLYAGEGIDGLPLTAILRQKHTVSFVYGDCEPAAYDQGCAPPAEVQIWPSCVRNLDLYDGGPPGSPEVERTTIRGVSAVALEGGAQLELQTGSSTVVVFAATPARAARVARALRTLGSEGGASEPLPRAVEDAC